MLSASTLRAPTSPFTNLPPTYFVEVGSRIQESYLRCELTYLCTPTFQGSKYKSNRIVRKICWTETSVYVGSRGSKSVVRQPNPCPNGGRFTDGSQARSEYPFGMHGALPTHGSTQSGGGL